MESKRMNKIKKAICRLAKKTAKYSVGRSVPSNFHEPRMPEALKKLKEE